MVNIDLDYVRNFACFATGLHVTEVAHDYQPRVTRYVCDVLELKNSYDTWHGKNHFYSLLQAYNPATILSGTKNVAKGLKSITQGAKKNEGKTWFSQLSDKSKLYDIQICAWTCNIPIFMQGKASKHLCTGL